MIDISVTVGCSSGRLSKEEIERMVKDAEKYKGEDDKQRDRIQAKNQLESYAFNMKSTVEDEKLKDKISDEDKATITEKCNEVISWLDSNQVSKGGFDNAEMNKRGIFAWWPLWVWWFHGMETFFHITVPLWRESIGERRVPITKGQ